MTNYDTFYNDFSSLTNISVSALSSIDKKKMALMCSYIKEGIESGENEISVDIGIGELIFIIENEEMRYKFIPSCKFEKMIVDTVVDGTNPLLKLVEEKVGQQTLQIYKELL